MNELLILLVGPPNWERQAVQRELQSRKAFQVIVAESGSEYLNAPAGQSTPVYVLLLPPARKRRSIRDDFPGLAGLAIPRFLVETDSATDDWLLDGIEAGAVGVLSWPVNVKQVRRALELAGQGDALMAPRAAGLLVRRAREHRSDNGVLKGLTPSECRVARLLAAACSNKEIAAQLQLSLSTVETHVSHVFLKLGVQSRAEALLALTQGKG